MTEPQQYASTVAVAGLAREVDALRRALEPIRPLQERVEEVAGLVAELAEATAAQATPAAVGLQSWLDLPADAGPAEAEQLLVDLVEWLRGIFLRYADGVRVLPDCWLWHPDVVEELVWLRAAWFAAYRSEDGSIAQAADWHDRQRPGVVRRIRETAGTCSIEAHLTGDHGRGGTGVPLADAAGAIATWWSTRPDEDAPEPTAEQAATSAASRRRSAPRGRS